MRTAGALCCASIAWMCLSACSVGPETQGSRSGPGVRGAAGTPSGDADEARRHLDVGLSRLRGGAGDGAASEALGHFYAARKLAGDGPLAQHADRAIGLAYFMMGDHGVARRYLQQGLPGAAGEEREVTIAELVICCRELDDVAGATAWRSRLAQPLSPSVRAILASPPSSSGRLGSLAPAAGAELDAAAAAPGAPSRPGAGSPGVRPPAGARLGVLGRVAWGATPTRSNVNRMGHVFRITIHHTAGPCFWETSREAAATEIRNIQRYHQERRHWADIGYHYLVDRAGNIWQGRPLQYQGAHARGQLNEGNIGIALLGNFCDQRPSRPQYLALANLVERLCANFRIPASEVYTHGELAPGLTKCPGPALTTCVHAIRRDLDRRLLAYRTDRR